jgi:hypothetical protein
MLQLVHLLMPLIEPVRLSTARYTYGKLQASQRSSLRADS